MADALADASNTEVGVSSILMKQASAEEKKDNGLTFACILSRGELLLEIPKKERLARNDGGPSHNYCLYSNPNVTMYDDGTRMSPLQGAELDYLLGIDDPKIRSVQYLEPGRLNWIMDLRHNDIVYFRLRQPSSDAILTPKGKVRYYGAIEECKGVLFGLEIMDPEHKGKGTTDGSPYFDCGPNNAVYVAMDKIIIKKTNGHDKEDPAIDFEQLDVVDKQPPYNTHSKSKVSDGEPPKEKGWVDVAKDMAKDLLTGKPKDKDKDMKNREDDKANRDFNADVFVPLSATSTDTHSKFRFGDRVVIYTAKDVPVEGIVRWVGQVKPSRQTGGGRFRMAVVGVETDKRVDPEKDFPDLSVGVTGSHGQSLFNVSRGHGRIFLPEQMILTKEEHEQEKKNRKKLTAEEKEAKKWGTSVQVYKLQGELLSKGNQDRDRSYDKKINEQDKGNEENQATGVGVQPRVPRTKKSDELIGPEGTVNLGVESIREQQLEYERLSNQYKRANSVEEDHKNAVAHHDSQHVNQDFQSLGDHNIHSGGRQAGNYPDPTKGLKAGSYNYESNPPLSNQSPLTQSRQGYNSPSLPSSHGANEHRHIPHQVPPQDQPFRPQEPDNPHRDAVPRYPSVPSDTSQFTRETMVELPMLNRPPSYGVIKWIGTLPGYEGYYTGVEMDEPIDGCSDGVFNGKRYFTCPPGRGLFCLLSALRPDRRLMEHNQVPAAQRQDMKNPLAHISQYDDNDTPGGPELFSKYIGEEHGIQGHHNSCYLDATVFGLFALSDSFDLMLLEEPHTDIGRSIKRILWKGIVNPLRRYGVARFESIMELRNELETLGRMKGANKDEKDPEEFLNLLFKEILHVEPFISIKRPFGVENEFFVQLFFEVDNTQTGPPGTEKLIRQMFHEQKISFTTVPSKLLLQMPRFGKEFKMFNKIIPSKEINVKPLLDPASRGIQNCLVCLNSVATVCCTKCHADVFITDDDSTVYLCDECSKLVHKKRPNHEPEQLPTNRPMGDASAFSKMELLSVICIETSHYVCFTRADDKWLFHDSMADRVYDTFNIPRVTDVSHDLNNWVYNPENHQKLLQSPSRDIPECVRRFTQDIYMCVYINPDIDRYGVHCSIENTSYSTEV